MDFDFYAYNRTNLCPNPENASFVLKIIDHNTGAILVEQSGTISPGQQTFQPVSPLIPPEAFANGIAFVRFEMGVSPFAEEFTGARIIQKYHQGSTPSVPDDIFRWGDYDG